MAKYLDYEGLATVVGLLKDYTDGAAEGKQDRLEAGENITITGDVISATDTGVTGVTATGTAPLTLTGSVSGRTLELSGSVDTYSKSEIDEMVSTATAGGITKITAEGTGPLTLAAAQDGTAVAITGSVDLSSKQDKITAGTGLEFDGDTLNCTIDTTLFVVVQSLPSAPAEGNENKIHLVPMTETETNNIYVEYIYVNGSWEKLGELQATTDLSGYYTKSETDSAISSAVSGKQDTLTPGDNITISGTTISAKDTTYSEATSSAAGLMSASDKAKMDTLEEMTAITTAEIDALF